MADCLYHFRGRQSIQKNKVQAIWCGIDIPADINSGEYLGEVYIQPEGQQADTIFIKLLITDPATHNHGDNNPENMIMAGKDLKIDLLPVNSVVKTSQMQTFLCPPNTAWNSLFHYSVVITLRFYLVNYRWLLLIVKMK